MSGGDLEVKVQKFLQQSTLKVSKVPYEYKYNKILQYSTVLELMHLASFHHWAITHTHRSSLVSKHCS